MPRDFTNSVMAQVMGDPPSKTSKSFNITVDTLKEDTNTNLKKMTIAMAVKVTKCEERNVFLADLVKLKLGTKAVEGYIMKQKKLRGKKDIVFDDFIGEFTDEDGVQESNLTK
jgi:hypothetical protein